MRQLRLTPQTFATPEAQAQHEAAWAAAAQALAALPVPPDVPPALQDAFGPDGQRFILSLARQHQNRGLSPVELVQAGHQALVAFAGRWAGLPAKWQDGWGWWARQGIMRAVKDGEE